jgi:ABC-2 type transport system permease protein
MTHFLRFAKVIARRDFLAVVASPTFLMFLLTPLIMIAMSTLLGSIASGMERGESLSRIAAIASPADAELLSEVDKRIRTLGSAGERPPLVMLTSEGKDEARADGLFATREADYIAVLYGPLDRPVVKFEQSSRREGAYLTELAEQAARARAARLSGADPLSKVEMVPLVPQRAGNGARLQLASTTVFALFMIILMLAGQAVGMLAEEKSNKVIEIIAAAAPLESVFFGKLIGMFGVALLFLSFWLGLGGAAIAWFGKGSLLAGLDPAVGKASFFLLCAIYFTMSYMLLSAVFLGLGALAPTMRDLQMLSLPITIFQMGMFALASQGAGNPGSTVATMAEWIPYSSPFAMAARAVTDEAIWPHVIAIGWQMLWVALTIWIAARLFRVGVLKSGNWKTALGLGRA